MQLSSFNLYTLHIYLSGLTNVLSIYNNIIKFDKRTKKNVYLTFINKRKTRDDRRQFLLTRRETKRELAVVQSRFLYHVNRLSSAYSGTHE